MRRKLTLILFFVLLVAVGVVWSAFEAKTAQPGVSPEAFKALPYEKQKETLESLADAEPEKAWGLVKSAYYVDGTVVGNAHEHAHIVGNELYDHFGFEGVEVCDPAFAYGCYHGVTEVMLAEQGPQAIPEIQSTCLEKFPPAETMNYTGCIHGAGHGLFTWALFELDDALALCNDFDESYQNYCYDGVFMERSFVDPTLEISESDPWQQCRDLDEKYRHSCGRYQQQAFRTALGWGDAQVAEVCEVTPSERLKETCFLSIGYSMAQRFSSDAYRGVEVCEEIFSTEEGVAVCSRGVANEITFQQYPNWREVSTRICEGIASDGWRRDCFNMRDKTIEIYNL